MSGYRPLTAAEIEQKITLLSDTLESETHEYRDLAEQAASAEADYKLGYHRAIIAVAAGTEKLTAPVKEARANLAVAEEYRESKILNARLDATKQTLTTLRTQLDAVRTLAANVRAQT